jgi:hypothetical protein
MQRLLLIIALSLLSFGCSDVIVFETQGEDDMKAFEKVQEQLGEYSDYALTTADQMPSGGIRWKMKTVPSGHVLPDNSVMCVKGANGRQQAKIFPELGRGGTIYIGECAKGTKRLQAVMHEIGHAIGLKKHTKTGVMSGHVDPTLTFSEESVDELKGDNDDIK